MPINIDEDADRLSKFEKGITNILSRNKNLLFENALAGINSHFGSAATEHYYNFIVQAWENVTGEKINNKDEIYKEFFGESKLDFWHEENHIPIADEISSLPNISDLDILGQWESDNITYKFGFDSSLEIYWKKSRTTASGNYTLDGNQIKFAYRDTSWTGKILSFSENEMQILDTYANSDQRETIENLKRCEKTKQGEFISISKRLDHYERKFSKTISDSFAEIEDSTLNIDDFLRKLNQNESKLLFRYAEELKISENMYEHFFIDKKFAYDRKSLKGFDRDRFKNREDEIVFFSRKIKNLKENFFESGLQQLIFNFFDYMQNKMDLTFSTSSETNKQYFYTAIAAVVLTIILTVISTLIPIENRGDLEFFIFHNYLFISGFTAFVLRFIRFSLLNESKIKKDSVINKVIKFFEIIFAIPLLLIFISPPIYILYFLIVSIMDKRRRLN